MTPPLTPLKKAAILLASLDDETADDLLAQMEPEHAARVRRQMMALGEIDPDVQRRVVAEFRHGEQPPRDPYPSGIELDSGLAEKIARADSSPLDGHFPSPPEPVEEPAPFRFLHQAEADTLVDSLKHERPQTIALVVSHLAPSQAAAVVDRLPPALQAQVLRRLSELDETDPAVLREVERYLESWFSEHMRSRERRRAGMQALSAIISAAGRDSRQQIVANLARHDSSLAATLGFEVAGEPSTAASIVKPSDTAPPTRRDARFDLCFADVMKLNDARLRTLVAAAEPDVLVLALAGADAMFVERVASCQTARQARLLRRALAHLGPTRLSDVEEAQQALAELVGDPELSGDAGTIRNRAAAMAV
ncbi:MAG: FliG C-terminal domain-containing protein [Pirellulales bacterium]